MKKLWLLLLATNGCSESATGPGRFPHAEAVQLWIYATGLVLEVGDTVQQGFTVRDTRTDVDYYSYPVGPYDPWPTGFRVAWWSSAPEIASVDNEGHVTARRSGRAVVWVQVESGRDSGTVFVAPREGSESVKYSEVTLGSLLTCGLSTERVAYCWGSDANGSLGRGRMRWFTSAAAPGPVGGGAEFVRMATGSDHSCGLTAAGETFCWGRNFHGELGDGTDYRDFRGQWGIGRARPVAVLGPVGFVTLVTGASHTCGLDAAGSAYCWGSNSYGQLGVGTYVPGSPLDLRNEPTSVVGGLRFVALTAGPLHSCGLTEVGEAYCWGANYSAQLGTGTTERCSGLCSTSPVRVSGNLRFDTLAAGLDQTCGLTPDGRAFCWGGNGRGQLGVDSVAGSIAPLPVMGDLRFVALTAGSEHTCGRTQAGTAYCWGENTYGQLGNGSQSGYEPNPLPQRVLAEESFTSLDAGSRHTCGITRDGDILCWGWNRRGQLGNGTIKTPNSGGLAVQTTPVRVVPPF